MRCLSAVLRAAVPVLISSVLTLNSVCAETPRASERTSAKARLSNSAPDKVSFSPVDLKGGSRLTLVSPKKWSTTATGLIRSLENTHREYSQIFGDIPPFVTTLRLMDEETFYLSTGAPRWTNAMYFKNQILIPMSVEGESDYDNLVRSIKHEYTHAVIHALSNGKCPGWLDEGLAQWAEGDENPALRPALSTWLKRNDVVSLKILQGGFTKLETRMVAAAYAQSLYAAEYMINGFGFDKIKSYFDDLRSGNEKEDAFQNSFGISEISFERKLAGYLKGELHGAH